MIAWVSAMNAIDNHSHLRLNYKGQLQECFMYVCLCNAVTDSDIRDAVDAGVSSFRQLKQTTKCATRCGQCTRMANDVFKEALSDSRSAPDFLPVLQPA